jgi:hypothetical protein
MKESTMMKKAWPARNKAPSFNKRRVVDGLLQSSKRRVFKPIT